MKATRYLVTFSIQGRRLALPLNAVERVVWAVEVTPLPEAPATVAGLINVQGRLLPVLDLRPRFGLSPRAVESDDQFILVHGAGRTVVLCADAVEGVEACDGSELVTADAVLPGSELIEGVCKRPDGLILVCNPKQIVPLVEQKQLADALSKVADGGTRAEEV